ncbi:MAG: SMP-30/gluconolactonase/LRE family protein [Alphaproteobacteria bacterium]
MANRVVAKDVLEPEGPVCLEDGQVYLVEMAKARACVSRIDRAGGRHEVGRPGGRPNGLTIDGSGNLWIAGGDRETVVCMAPDGRILKSFLGPDGDPYLWPNDLAFGPNGLLYLTDSGILPDDFIDGQKIRDDYRTVPYHGRVFELDPKNGKVLRTLDTGLRFTNGIAFDADDVLYVNETLSGNVYRYDVFGKAAPKREVFGNVINGKPDAFVGPDGMAFGADRRLYCTVFGQGDVTVLDRAGKLAERIKTNGQRPTNIAFREGADGAVVTDLGTCELEEIAVPCRGRALYKPVVF